MPKRKKKTERKSSARIEHNEHFEIQGVDQWLEGKQIT